MAEIVNLSEQDPAAPEPHLEGKALQEAVVKAIRSAIADPTSAESGSYDPKP